MLAWGLWELWVGSWESWGVVEFGGYLEVQQPREQGLPGMGCIIQQSSRLMTLITSANSRFLDGSPSQMLNIRYGWNKAWGVGKVYPWAQPS